MEKKITDAVEFLASLKYGETVKVTFDGRTNDMSVSRAAHRADGPFGEYESTRVTVTYGPGRYAREVTAGQIADGSASIEKA